MDLNTVSSPTCNNLDELHILITFTIWKILNSIQPDVAPYENYGKWIII